MQRQNQYLRSCKRKEKKRMRQEGGWVLSILRAWQFRALAARPRDDSLVRKVTHVFRWVVFRVVANSPLVSAGVRPRPSQYDLEDIGGFCLRIQTHCCCEMLRIVARYSAAHLKTRRYIVAPAPLPPARPTVTPPRWGRVVLHSHRPMIPSKLLDMYGFVSNFVLQDHERPLGLP